MQRAPRLSGGSALMYNKQIQSELRQYVKFRLVGEIESALGSSGIHGHALEFRKNVLQYIKVNFLGQDRA